MSIATNSVLRRILDEVRRGPSPIDPGALEACGDHEQCLEARRTSDVHQPPFATSLHFWAHALRAFLAARGRPELFDALANHCLCEAADPLRIASALDALGRRVHPPLATAPAGVIRAGYRMLDHEWLESWLAESDGEFVAVFWVHAPRLLAAKPIVLG
jgi:hypothetical protein